MAPFPDTITSRSLAVPALHLCEMMMGPWRRAWHRCMSEMAGWGRSPNHWKEHHRGPGLAFHPGKSAHSRSTRARLNSPHRTAGSFPMQHSVGASNFPTPWTLDRAVIHLGVSYTRHTFFEFLYHNRHHPIQLYRWETTFLWRKTLFRSHCLTTKHMS